MVELKCKSCGKSFAVANYRTKSARYCSRRCRAEGVYRDLREKGHGLAAIDHSHSKGNTYRKGLRPTNAFPKGNQPWNKNVTGIHLSPRSEFKVGIEPANKMVVGSITHRADKNGTVRNYIKVAEPNVWRTYATYLWEKAHGKVPDGCVVHHVNWDASDDRMENFEVLPRAEHALEHSSSSFPSSKVVP